MQLNPSLGASSGRRLRIFDEAFNLPDGISKTTDFRGLSNFAAPKMSPFKATRRREFSDRFSLEDRRSNTSAFVAAGSSTSK